MQKINSKKWWTVKSGLVIFLTLALILSPLSGLGVSALATEMYGSDLERDKIHEFTFNFNGGSCRAWDQYGNPYVSYGPMTFYFEHNEPIMVCLLPGIEGGVMPLERPGYIFAGWCTVGDGSALLTSEDFLLKGWWTAEESMTFYAIWKPWYYGMHKFVWHFNGGSAEAWDQYGNPYVNYGPMTFYFEHNEPIMVCLLPGIEGGVMPLTRPGYIFTGWCTVGDGSALLTSEDFLLKGWWTAEESMTFYAIWQRIGNLPCAETNLARTAAMSASSADGVRTADRANNGILTGAANSWSAASAGQEWLMADFGQPLNFNHINLYQGGNRIANYRFEHSNDGVNWTEFRSGARIMEQGATPYSFTTPSTITARYVRLFSANSFGVLPIVVFEFEIYYMP